MSMSRTTVIGLAGPKDELSNETFDGLRTVVYERCGIVLGDNKQALVKARIQKRLRRLGLDSYADYLALIRADTSGTEVGHLVDALSTNVTSFYREPRHFTFMRAAIEAWLASGLRKLRIWSAACSSGEEPYTIAIEVSDLIGSKNIDVRILATDISTKVLKRCRRGEFTSSHVKPVPPMLRQRFFTRMTDRPHTTYAVTEELRRLVIVRQFNLAAFPYAVSGPLDIIFCRNVMIYFDQPTRERMVSEFHRILRPDGYLFTGHAETLLGSAVGFETVEPAVYLRR